MFDSPVIPDSKYINDKLLNPDAGVEFHAVCSNCSVYLGEFRTESLPETCHLCNTAVNLKQSIDESFFALINPSSQIRDVLQINEEHYENIMNRDYENNHIEDIYDGKMYRDFRKKLPLETQKIVYYFSFEH
ncbi:hypothetical protein TKK_0015344 [Trichogramma kaykai]